MGPHAVTEGCEPPCGSWQSSSGRASALSPEPSFQPVFIVLFFFSVFETGCYLAQVGLKCPYAAKNELQLSTLWPSPPTCSDHNVCPTASEQRWGLKPGLCACEANSLPTELHPATVFITPVRFSSLPSSGSVGHYLYHPFKSVWG